MHSAHQSRNVDLNPCGTQFSPIRRQTATSVMFETLCRRCGDWKITSLSSTSGVDSSSAMAAELSGTRCSRPPFMRAAGTIHVLDAKSISGHLARRTSPDRAAVRIANSRARAPLPSTLASALMKRGISATGSAV